MVVTATETETTVVFEPSARITDAEAIFAGLAEVLATPAPLVTIDLKAVEAADVSLYQLLLVFQQKLRENGRHLLVRSLPAHHAVLETAALVGLPLEHHVTFVEALP